MRRNGAMEQVGCGEHRGYYSLGEYHGAGGDSKLAQRTMCGPKHSFAQQYTIAPNLRSYICKTTCHDLLSVSTGGVTAYLPESVLTFCTDFPQSGAQSDVEVGQESVSSAVGTMSNSCDPNLPLPSPSASKSTTKSPGSAHP